MSGSVSPLEESAQRPPMNICQVLVSAIAPPVRSSQARAIADRSPVSRVSSLAYHPRGRPGCLALTPWTTGVGLTLGRAGRTMEVSSGGDPMHRYLVVANRTLAGAHLFEQLTELTRHDRCSFRVVVPAEPPRDHAWTETEARSIAAARLEQALARFAALDAEVDGEVGDADPALAVEDVLLRGETFDAIVLSTLPPGPSRWLRLDLPHRLEGKTGLRVIHVIGHPEPAAAGSG